MSESIEISMNRLYSQKLFMELESYNKEWMCKQSLRLSLFPHCAPILIKFPFSGDFGKNEMVNDDDMNIKVL